MISQLNNLALSVLTRLGVNTDIVHLYKSTEIDKRLHFRIVL